MRDEGIIQAIRNGDEGAMDTVMNQYARLLWTIVGAVLKPVATEQDLEECVADVFIYLWRNPEKYDPGRGTLKVWLSVVARSQALDKYRELTRHTVLPLEEALPTDQLGLAEGLLAREEKRDLLAAVQALEEPDREILIRRYYHDQKPREIATALGMTVKQVDNHLYRTKGKLRAALAR